MDFSQSLSEWAKDKPLSILQLDPADRAVLKIADERDAIQKKTFTKWLNKHLKKTNRNVDDLFEDLRDGHNLISLLEVLSGELLARERGRLRFHQLQNVQTALDFLRTRNIKLVNIRPEDIVDGNPKLTLGLIWTIILHFQISDIITGLDDNVTAREALLNWAQRTTERYPGVRITDFCKSWRDGLAFNAILHRNRPDILDYRSLKTRNPRENLELAFSLAEKEFGITRLLDPEDVDTPEPDEKSLITYISSFYDVFPDPPSYHPFADDERNRKVEEYKALAFSLQKWMHELSETLKNQIISNSLIDLKNLLLESSKFRSDELPKQLRNKQRLCHLYRDVQKSNHHSSQIECRDLPINEIETNWSKVITALDDRDKKIKDEICRLEKLQRLSEKITRDLKVCDNKIEEVEKRIKEEEKRINRLIFLDAKQNCDLIENDFKCIDSLLKSLEKDITSLENKKYHQIGDLQCRWKNSSLRYQNIKEVFQTNLLLPLSEKSGKNEEKKVNKQKKQTTSDKSPIDQNQQTTSVKEHLEWIDKKKKYVLSINSGRDVSSLKSSLEHLQSEQKAIDAYSKKIDSIIFQKNFQENDTCLNNQVEVVVEAFKELFTLVNEKVKETEDILDFVQSATKALKWMTDKEEVEVSRDWSAKNLNILELEHHQELLTSELEKKETHFNAIQNKGESLLLQKHPCSKSIEDLLSKIQNQWSKVLQLTLCLEIHLKNAKMYQKFFKEAKEHEHWIKKTEDKLHSSHSKSIVSVDEGERGLKQMEILKNEIYQSNDSIQELVNLSQEVIPLKQRKLVHSQISKPFAVIALCSYASPDVTIKKGEKFELKEIQKKLWKVSYSAGNETIAPGVIFSMQPPDSEAVEIAQNLKKRYEALLKLWKLKQKKLRQNLIFATIKVIKSWDVSQMSQMDASQRDSIMSALNSDAQKLLLEETESDDILSKLKLEIEQCNFSYQNLLKKIAQDSSEKTQKNVEKKLLGIISSLQTILNEKEKFLQTKLAAAIVSNLDSLENLVIEHKEFEMRLRNLEDQINDIIETFKSTDKKSKPLKGSFDHLTETWSNLWNLSNLYIEKLKAIEIHLVKLNEALQSVSELEVKLVSCNKMSSKLNNIQKSHDDLLIFQEEMQLYQVNIDGLIESSRKTKQVLQKIKSKIGNNIDFHKLESDTKKVMTRWDNARTQIIERLRSCGASSELLKAYKSKVEPDSMWITETTVKMNSLKTVKKLTTKEIELIVEPAMDLYSNVTERGSLLEETNTIGSRYIREAKIAVQENYQVCEENAAKLESWMKDIKLKLADLGVIQEEIFGLQHQIATVKVLKDQVESQQLLVTTCLDQMRQLAQRGLEVLTKEEINNLQKNLISIKRHYDLLMNDNERILKRLVAAFDELQKYKVEMKSFKEWLHGVQLQYTNIESSLGLLSQLEKSSDLIRFFSNDVIAHQADLRFISMAAQKFYNESQDYLKLLNSLRSSLPEKLSPVPAQTSEVKSEVQEVTTVFHHFLNDVNKLTDSYVFILNKYRIYSESLEKAKICITEIRHSVNSATNEIVAGEPLAIQSQLDKIKIINMEVVGQSRLIETVYQSVKSLTDAMESCKIQPTEANIIENALSTLQDDYSVLSDQIAKRITNLQTALIHSQDFQAGFERILKWLAEVESSVRMNNKPIDLISSKLDEQVQECKILKSDINNQKQSVDMLVARAHESANKNPSAVKNVNMKLNEVAQRFSKVTEDISKLCSLLEEVSESLHSFEEISCEFDEWFISILGRLDTVDNIPHNDIDGFLSIVDYCFSQKNTKKDDFNKMIQKGKKLITRKDISNATKLKDKIEVLEKQWKQLEETLQEKKQLGVTRAERINVFNNMYTMVLDCLAKMEKDFEKLEPFTFNNSVLQKQITETMHLMKEHSDFSSQLEKFNKLGLSCETVLKDNSSKVKISSPVKKPSSPMRRSPSKSHSSDNFSSYSHRGLVSSQSPVSTVSSGFSSIRSSSDNIRALDELSTIQQQLTEVNDRYNNIGNDLCERNRELSEIKEELNMCLKSVKTLSSFLDEKSHKLSKDGLPFKKGILDSQTDILKGIHLEMLEKQSELETLKSKVKNLLTKKKALNGTTEIEIEINKLDHQWETINGSVEKKLSFMSDFKEYQESLLHMKNWLTSREKMFQVLGPIASEPRMVISQVQQVQVMKEEFTSQESYLNCLKDLSAKITIYLKSIGASSIKTEEEIDSIEKLFKEMSRNLIEREKNLESAVGLSKDFYKNLNELQTRLLQISDKFDKFEEEGYNFDVLLKKIKELEEELEKLRSKLIDASSDSEKLCDVLIDASSKTEIKCKVNVLEKSYSNIQKKIDFRKAEIESILNEDKEFYKVCEDIQQWLNEIDSKLNRPHHISTDVIKLSEEMKEYDLYYKDIMKREHEVYLCLSKGSDILAKLSEKQEPSVKKKLETIKKKFEKVKSIATSKSTALRSCYENCKLLNSTLNTFEPWLGLIEEKLKRFETTCVKRDILNQQMKEIQLLRSEMSLHSQEFQNIQKVGEEILSRCDSEKDGLKKSLDILKKKWKRLNDEVSVQVQLLEELSQLTFDFEEKYRDLQHTIQRLEDRLCSHDALGEVSCDRILLERLEVLLTETVSLKKDMIDLKKYAKLAIEKAGSSCNSSEIMKSVETLDKRHQSLQKDLEKKCSLMSTSYKVVSEFLESVRVLQNEINVLEETFDEMHSISRDYNLLMSQLKEIKDFKTSISKTRDKYAKMNEAAEDMAKNSICGNETYSEQIKTFYKKILRLEEKINERENTIQNLILRVETFQSIFSETLNHINSLLQEEKHFKFDLRDIESIRLQQKDFKKMRDTSYKSLGKKVMEVNKLGQGLVQSASKDVDTSNIEKRLDTINNTWNDLQESINEREKKLDIALLQSGKYQEALYGVEKWLIDTEEMVSNQKAPSFDFKVVKAQVQEQKFLKKMLLDRQNSVISLKTLCSEFVNTSNSTENEQSENLMKNISSRFEELICTANERMVSLEKTIPVAQEFQNVSSSLIEWLENSEKKLSAMSSIPVEEKLIKALINDHKVMSSDIEQHKDSIKCLNIISHELKEIVNQSETESMLQKVNLINEKFSEIETLNQSIGSLLDKSQKGISNFSVSYTQVITTIEEIAVKLTKFQRLSAESEKLHHQLTNLKVLKEKFDDKMGEITNVVSAGEEIMKFVSGEDAIQIKEKLDSLSLKVSETSNKLNERLKVAEESFPLIQSFYSSISKLNSWFDSVEKSLKLFDNSSLDVQSDTIKNLESCIPDYRFELDNINNIGPRLNILTPGESSVVYENQISRANTRFEKIFEQIQRKAERVRVTLQRKFDVIGDIEELSEWFKETEKQVNEAGGLTSEPSYLITLLKEQKSLCDDLNSQKNKVRVVTAAAKKLLRDSSSDDLSCINEKIETLKNQSTNCFQLCQERLNALEQALPLAQHFFETHSDLGQWLDEVEGEAERLEAPALNSVQIKRQNERNKNLTQSVQEHKPLVEKLNKTGSALTRLCKEEESDKIEVILESDNSRYNALRKILREHQVALEEALQATSQFSDKLEGILNALTSTADQLNNAEPISAHPDRIQEQINDNIAVLQDLDKRTLTLEAVKKAADDVIGKASKIDEPAVKDIKMKLDQLNELWLTIQKAAQKRGKSLEEALTAAEKFWDELTAVMKALKELQSSLNAQEPPAVEPAAVHHQQEVLQEIKQEINQTKPEVDHCRKAGQNLMQLCGEPDKPEVKKHIEDLDSVWENVTTLYAKREENLVHAMEKAMIFHETLQNLLEFLDTFEHKFNQLGAVSTDIESVKNQIKQLKEFKSEVDPHMIEIEAINRQAQELMERVSPDQAVTIREPLFDINKRWEDLLGNIVDRQQEMDEVLLKLGQFQHALEEQLTWITKTERTLDELKPVLGDPQVIEVVLAKHKVISNDIESHQSSIDAINRAGREFVDVDHNSEESKHTLNKLQGLKLRWQNLQDKSADRYKELEDALKEAQKFHQDIQDLLIWLSETDGHLITSKPVGGLPETAKEQLNRFMEIYNELESNRYKVENILQQGHNYTKKSGESSTKNLLHNLRILKQRWDSILNKASDRKIKLEIALREATEFHEALQVFVEWLTNSEKYLCSLKPVSRHMKAVLEQIEEHRNFQKDLSSHREVMLNLDKKGTHLKYFSQKQDVILIKNLLISVQHRWEKVVSKAAERTRALDHGYKESKEFHDSHSALSSWLDETEKILYSASPIGNDPIKIKKLLAKHKEFQRSLGSKQVTYDATMKCGRILKDKCPKQDMQLLQNMMDELKSRWNKVCSKSVDRQRKLEEALLFSGQFKEAVIALLDWIDKAISSLSESKPYHGDLDTVTSLIEQHKAFEEEFKNKGLSLESVCKSAANLKEQVGTSDVESITLQIEELNKKWNIITNLNEKKKTNLQEALQLAEELYQLVHMLLEWLSDAEMKLRFFGSLPEDEDSSKKQIQDHELFLKELESKEISKSKTLELSNEILKKCHPDGISIIRHWITIIQSRWDEIYAWAKQRDQRLRDHLLSLRDLSDLLEDLLAWLNNAESNLTALEAEPLPDDLPSLNSLIENHQIFMADMSKKQTDIEKVSKPFSPKRHPSKNVTPQMKEKGKDKVSRIGASIGVRSSPTIRGQFDTDVKHPRARLLLEKWRVVWLLAMERQRRLQDKYNYLLELDSIKHFDFNNWRSRYLGWLNNKKSRVMDEFKKIDKNNQGKITKQEFIEGILKSKFTTSRLEMERVSEIFDRNGDGFIDNKEYIETLKPDKEDGPKTEAEKIQDEVQRQVAKCTCIHRFKVYQVGEGKYRFGDSQKLRLVRILRSTVMVRVGGGWVALDEFLVKNDPCRAKGRTNLELREQFILADGVSQSLAPFKPKPSPNSPGSSQSGMNSSMQSTGPITKIREKSERSTPMRRNRSSAENSSDISGPSFSETDSYRSGYSKATPSSSRLNSRDASCKSSSRPTSRLGSKPPSRAPSDLSQDGSDEYKSKQQNTISGNGHIKKKISSSDKNPDTPNESSKIPSVKKLVKHPRKNGFPK